MAHPGVEQPIVLDFETRNTGGCKLKSAGAWRYAADPATTIVTLTYHAAGEYHLWTPVDGISDPLVSLAADPTTNFVCFSNFELAIWQSIMVERFGFPAIPISKWHDVQAVCAYHALPLDLARVSTALEMPIAKDHEGRQVTLALSRPGNTVPYIYEFTSERLDDLFEYLTTRHAAECGKQAGRPWPWTSDFWINHTYLGHHERELHHGTIEIAKLVREPYSDDPDLWFATAIARVSTNWAPTIAELMPLLPWDSERFIAVAEARKARGETFEPPRFAYTIRPGLKGVPKAEYHACGILTPLWNARDRIRPRQGDTLAAFAARLKPFEGLGDFYIGQIIADLKYVEPLHSAADWWSWAVPGPGSQRGMNYVIGRDRNATWSSGWFRCLTLLIEKLGPRTEAAGLPRLHAQDWQNVLCEYHKWSDYRAGVRQPRRWYRRPETMP